jgi:hypothetical protein
MTRLHTKQKVDTGSQALLRVSDYLISASLFQRLIVHVLEAFVAAWPYIRHHALPGVKALDTGKGPGPLPTTSVFDGDQSKQPARQGTEWLVEFVRWGHVSRAAVRRRWMECVELVGCDMVDGGVRLPVGARAVVRELLAPSKYSTRAPYKDFDPVGGTKRSIGSGNASLHAVETLKAGEFPDHGPLPFFGSL